MFRMRPSWVGPHVMSIDPRVVDSGARPSTFLDGAVNPPNRLWNRSLAACGDERRPATVVVDEFDAGGFQRSAKGKLVSDASLKFPPQRPRPDG